MITNEHELHLRNEMFEILGCSIEVLNKLGPLLLEKSYENALVVEFGLRDIAVKQQIGTYFNMKLVLERFSEVF